MTPSEFYTLLTGHSGFSAIVKDVSRSQAAKNTAKPYATYFVPSEYNHSDLEGLSDTEFSRYQLDIYSDPPEHGDAAVLQAIQCFCELANSAQTRDFGFDPIAECYRRSIDFTF